MNTVALTIKPTIRKFAIEFDNGGGITLETRGYTHSYAKEIQCAEDVKVILAGGNPAKDGWDGNEIEDGVRCDHSQSSTTYNLSELIEVLKSGEIPEGRGAAEAEFWKALGLTDTNCEEADPALIEKVSGFADGIEVSEYKLCSGAGIGEYVFVNAQVIISFEMNGKQESIVYQNGHGYRGNDYNCPSNLFQVYHNNGDWLQKIENLDFDLEKEDQDDLQDIVNASNGILKTTSEIDFLRDFINENRPTLSDIDESSDVDDYDITADEDDYPVVTLKSDLPENPKVLVTAKLLADVVKQGWIEVRSGIYLNHRDSIMEEQKDWCEEDTAKKFDFSTDEFWLTTNDGEIQSVEEGDEI